MTAIKQTRSARSSGPGSPQRRPLSAPGQPAVDHDDADLEFRVDLSDVPLKPMGLNVDGLKPTVLSRVLGLFQR